MDDGTGELASAIGARVKHERTQRRLTLDQLADGAGVSRRMLINIEQGAANPSVGTLLKISDTLGVGLPTLVESPREKSVSITRSGDGAILWTGAQGGRGEMVASTEGADVVELWDWTLEPGDRHDSDAHASGTRELIHVQQGTIQVTSGTQTITLNERDAISFPGDVAHSYINSSEQQARFALTVFDPGVQSQSRGKNTGV
ncbi:MAG TPA: XRE family transcriptional regulator [Glaciihabitans sp.]|jgi:transcriptional regulator with XRE-family HTH domain|nr:XRE family transcriptional regulator [Glaciihabitans sp.]